MPDDLTPELKPCPMLGCGCGCVEHDGNIVCRVCAYQLTPGRHLYGRALRVFHNAIPRHAATGMIDAPRTRRLADDLWTVVFQGQRRFYPSQCAYAVEHTTYAGRRYYSQCHYKPGHGPAELYCDRHAKTIERNEKCH